ncbi:MAG: hypothetical protein JWO77_1360 [Ilumatobacteraceae bacterium]|nr:hypothetical protein [Ilumatobacteraceae bacterium]
MPTGGSRSSTAQRLVAALVALGLGLTAAVLAVAGHPPWEGPTVLSLTETHGLHQGDVIALIPLGAGAWLAWWCWDERRR